MSPDDNGGSTASTAYHPPVAAPAGAPPNRRQRRAMQKMARSAAKRAKREAEAAARVPAAHAAEPPHVVQRDTKPDNVQLEKPVQSGVERFLDDNGPRAPAADVLEAALTSVVESRPAPPITTNAPGNGSEKPASLAEKIRAAKKG